MAGEYQLAKSVLDDAIGSIADKDGMREDTFARAMMSQLMEYYGETRQPKDIISELEQHIRTVQDEGESVITRGC